MNQQDQEISEEDSSTMDVDDEQAIDQEEDYHRLQELIKQEHDETAGSVSSNRKILVKIKTSMVAESPPPPEIFWAGEKKKSAHYCKECNKSFSSGKALGGHMSSAHVQANNKDYSNYKKLQKSKMMMKAHIKSSGSSYSGLGPEENACGVCGKLFPSPKSLYGHMRCHPDRYWRGMEPPVVEPRMESSEASTEPRFEYTGLDQESDHYDNDVCLTPHDAVARPVGFVDTLKGWPVTAKRGRSARPENVSPPVTKYPPPLASSSEEVEPLSAGHELLRLLKRNQLDSGKKFGGDVDKGMSSNSLARQWPELDTVVTINKKPLLPRHGPELDAGVINSKKPLLARHGPELDAGVKKPLLARHGPELDAGVKKPLLARHRPDMDAGVINLKKHKRDYTYNYPVKKPVVFGMESNYEPKPETKGREQARDCKRKKRAPKVMIRNTNDDNGNKVNIAGGSGDKGKGKAVDHKKPNDEITESEFNLYFGAISVLANAKRENYAGPDDSHHHHHHKQINNIDDDLQEISSERRQPANLPITGELSKRSGPMMMIGQKDGSGPSEEHICITCKKVFTSHQALGGHRSSHNKKLMMNIVNTIDNISINNNLQQADTKPVVIATNNRESSGDDDEDEEEEKVVMRGFDLNMMPGDHENGGAAGDIN